MAEVRKTIMVKTFPRLVISDGKTTVTENDIRSDMVIRLFAYLICSHKKVCGAEELAAALWPGDESVNPAGALKNLAYRLRQIMKKYFPQTDFIRTGRGGYSWNPDLPICLDADTLVSEIRKAEKTEELDGKIRHYSAAFSVYKGRFLESIAEDAWVVPKLASYENLFRETASNYTELLGMTGDYIEMEDVARTAIGIDPLEEKFHMALIRALVAEERHSDAEEHYRVAAKLLYDNLGIGPSEEMKRLFDAVMEQEHRQETDLTVIQEELHEAETPHGAFYCEYGVFKKIYELEARRTARMGMTIFLSLITMHAAGEANEMSGKGRDVLDRGMAQMLEVMIDSLRTGDVCTRYSANQYLIMLPACPYENARAVTERILKNYEHVKRRAKVEIGYTLKEMEPAMEGMHGNPVCIPSTLRVLIDVLDAENGHFSGRITGIAVERDQTFRGTQEFLRVTDTLLNKIGRPQPGRLPRHFTGGEKYVSYKAKPELFRPAEEIMEKKGNAATYDLEFRSRSYSTWQGFLYEEGGKEPAYFSSELELLNLMLGSQERGEV
ncbi:MAG: hypothetical protein IJJ52_00380 [Lachnospiraceae bacterium]|nr:hypothetical protein [Lachnospiraceae bacterium]